MLLQLSILDFEQAMSARKEGDEAECERLLNLMRKEIEVVLGNRKWETEEIPELTSLIYYAKACCLCRLAETDPTAANSPKPLLDEAYAALKKASDNGRATKP